LGGGVATAGDLFTRALLGRPLRSDRVEETLLPKRLALPVFCSDPLSSVAYATEQIVLVLGLGGLGLLYLTPWLGLAVVALLVIVVASYRQTCAAYPNGGGAYAVSRENLGIDASLVAASALLIDYVLTVAVSIVAGVAAITSAIPSLAVHAVGLSLGFVVLLTAVNLRGVKESGRAFAVPTYGFVVCILAMIGVAFAKIAFGDGITAESAHYGLRHATQTGGTLTIFLALRAFASGCTALTGVEAVSNGVPAFREPKSRNAAQTLVIMGGLAIVMFAAITALAVIAKVHMAENTSDLIGFTGTRQTTALSQIARATFGETVPFYLVQAFTAAILVLAANTAYNGFPLLTSLLGRDGHLPRQLSHRGDRLVFSNGIVVLAGMASLLIVAFDADVTRLIHLYILGVFLSFTLSQAGMVRHWQRGLAATAPGARSERRRIRRSLAINGSGAVATALVLVVVLVTKFTQGAWIVVLAMPVVFATMKGIARHYSRLTTELAPAPTGVALPDQIHAVVLVSALSKPVLRALAFAKASRPASLIALKVSDDPADPLAQEWTARGVEVPLVVLESPYRETVGPVLRYVSHLRREHPGEVISVVIPEYVVGRWWENILHNQTALRLKARLRFEPDVVVTSVPWQLDR
jgi:amino acid transporter